MFSLATALQTGQNISHITGSVKRATHATDLNIEDSMLLFQEAMVKNSLLCVENIYVLKSAIQEIRAGEVHGYTLCPVLQPFAL